jgi:hypothetical protein
VALTGARQIGGVRGGVVEQSDCGRAPSAAMRTYTQAGSAPCPTQTWRCHRPACAEERRTHQGTRAHEPAKWQLLLHPPPQPKPCPNPPPTSPPWGRRRSSFRPIIPPHRNPTILAPAPPWGRRRSWPQCRPW